MCLRRARRIEQDTPFGRLIGGRMIASYSFDFYACRFQTERKKEEDNVRKGRRTRDKNPSPPQQQQQQQPN